MRRRRRGVMRTLGTCKEQGGKPSRVPSKELEVGGGEGGGGDGGGAKEEAAKAAAVRVEAEMG
eukprot:scaffold322345_cov37-Tisochrysis_lutea.AAC.3